MMRFAALLMFSAGAFAASAVDIDTAANIYLEAQVREQVRASLASMPKQIRDMFSRDASAQLDAQELDAVNEAAKRGFRIDVFETPALSALAQNLDAATVAKTHAFLESDLGKRMVAADVASATMGEANIDKVMSGQLMAPSTPKRDALIDQLEHATRSTESTVDIFLSMGQAVAIGTAIGSGLDQNSVAERARKSGEASRAGLEHDMRLPMRRFLAYSYRNLSDSDLKHLVAFLESPAGTRYVTAYNAAMGAGYDAMGRRTGEQLGESLRELAQAKLEPPPDDRLPPDIAAPQPPQTGPQSAPVPPAVPAPQAAPAPAPQGAPASPPGPAATPSAPQH
ncbi:MAG TPA: DUF2059 domain-containing protein [Steroidobacteraceae bacterium]|nr:DUF2059 domain-containing protein [Steroidobacteraceae bacterium]